MAPSALYNFFLKRIRENLHIAVTIDSLLDNFYNRLHMFPALLKCCTAFWLVRQPTVSITVLNLPFVNKRNKIFPAKVLCVATGCTSKYGRRYFEKEFCTQKRATIDKVHGILRKNSSTGSRKFDQVKFLVCISIFNA